MNLFIFLRTTTFRAVCSIRSSALISNILHNHLHTCTVQKPNSFEPMSDVKACHFTWKLSADDITKRTDTLIRKARDIYDELAAIEDPNWRNVARRLALSEAEYQTECNMLDFPQHVSPQQELRDASYAAARKLADLEVELDMRKDVFDKFVSILSNTTDTVPPEIMRYILKKVQKGRRNGLHLNEENKKSIEALSKEENQLCIEFEHAISQENTVLEFDESELLGCPDDFINGLKKLPNGKRQMTLKYPHYFPASEKAANPETRRKLEAAFNSRCAVGNKEILKRVLEIRKERASILGFPTHSDFMLDIRMAKSAPNVAKFLQNLGEKLRPIRVKQTERLLELKKEECERLGFEYTSKLEPCDLRYYMNMATERDYSVDKQLVKQYFPLDTVKSGILKLYQDLLGLSFTRIETQDLWHPDVEMYSVCDLESCNLLGYFYLDLHPRENKYSHAAVFGLQPGCLRQSPGGGEQDIGTRQVAVAAMVANFTGPTDTQPTAYLFHDEVETFFHEFGHVMHQLCAQADLALFSGTHVETDFVECPSQMLENWVWTEEGLRALLGDDLNGMPKELLNRLLKSRTANAGLFYSRQILLASYDQAIHTDRWQEDPLMPFVELSKKWMDITPTQGTFMPASFGHLCGGYDARYYGYLWSEVFSADLFETRFRCAIDGGCLSTSVGREYREKILRPGGTKDAIDMLKDFLGRDPSDAAFFKLLGLQC